MLSQNLFFLSSFHSIDLFSLICDCEHSESYKFFANKGAFINDVTQTLRISGPPSPSVTLKWLFYLQLYLRDIIYECSSSTYSRHTIAWVNLLATKLPMAIMTLSLFSLKMSPSILLMVGLILFRMLFSTTC